MRNNDDRRTLELALIGALVEQERLLREMEEVKRLLEAGEDAPITINGQPTCPEHGTDYDLGCGCCREITGI